MTNKILLHTPTGEERECIVQYVWGCWVLDYQWQLSKPEELYITYWQPMIPRPQKRGE